MPNLALTWQQGAALAIGLGAAAVLLRLAPRPRLRAGAPIAGESAIIAALYSLWQLAGTVSLSSGEGAYSRGESIVRFERDAHLPSELDVQHWVLPHRWLA